VADLVAVPDLGVRREHLKKVEDVDGGLVAEWRIGMQSWRRF
jgi:hypothetical protein